MLKNSNESDFYELDLIAYDRLSPDGITAFFWGTFVFSAIMTIVVLFALGSSPMLNSNWYLVLGLDLLIIFFHLIFSILFSIENIAYKFQRFQSVLLLFFSFKLSLDLYQVFFLMSEDRNAPSTLNNIAVILMLGGFVYLILSTIRAFGRVKKGEFRNGGKLLYDFQTSKAHVSIPVIFVVVMLGTAIFRTFSDGVAGMYFILLLCVVLQYAIAMAWPEFLLLTYCKFRFESFKITPPSERGRGRGKK